MAEPLRAARAGAKPAPVKSFPIQAGAAFWQGFSEPSGLAFRVFCVALLATCAFCFWFFSETTLAGPMGRYLPRSALDAEGFATHEALRSGHHAPDRPRLFVLGTSTVAQAIGDGEAVQERIREATGQDWDIVMLATPLQSPTDQFALLDRALESQSEDSPPALVALGFGVQRLRWNTEQTLEYAAMPRLGLRSDWADAEVRALGGTPAPKTGIYLWDNLAFVLINGSETLARIATLHPAKRLVDQYAHGMSHRPKQEVRDTLGAEIRAAAPEQPAYFAQIDRLAADIATVPHVRLVLIEEPLSPELIADQDLAPVRDALDAALAAFIADRPLEYWPISTEAGLTGRDYFDDLHVQPGAPQKKIQAALADHVVAATGGGNGG
jgi:hypothetical protein